MGKIQPSLRGSLVNRLGAKKSLCLSQNERYISINKQGWKDKENSYTTLNRRMENKGSPSDL